MSELTSWEYTVTPLLIHNPKAILDNWGVDGWELVTVLPERDGRAARRVLQASEGLRHMAETTQTWSERLAELGIALPAVAAPVACVRACGSQRQPRLHLGPVAVRRRKADADGQARCGRVG